MFLLFKRNFSYKWLEQPLQEFYQRCWDYSQRNWRVSMLHYVTLCYTMLHYVTLCYTMLHYVIYLSFVVFWSYEDNKLAISYVNRVCKTLFVSSVKLFKIMRFELMQYVVHSAIRLNSTNNKLHNSILYTKASIASVLLQ